MPMIGLIWRQEQPGVHVGQFGLVTMKLVYDQGDYRIFINGSELKTSYSDLVMAKTYCLTVAIEWCHKTARGLQEVLNNEPQTEASLLAEGR